MRSARDCLLWSKMQIGSRGLWVDLVQPWRVGFYLTTVKQELEAVIVFVPRCIQYVAHWSTDSGYVSCPLAKRWEAVFFCFFYEPLPPGGRKAGSCAVYRRPRLQTCHEGQIKWEMIIKKRQRSRSSLIIALAIFPRRLLLFLRV